jgi:hypothetical protein
MAGIIFRVTLAILLFRLIKMRMWLSLPAFFVYTAVSLAVDLIPNPMNNLDLWNIQWYIEVTLVMILRVLALIEVFWLAIMEFLLKERLYLLAALSACAVAALSLALLANPTWTPMHNFIVFRQCVFFGMLFWMALGGAYIWARDIALEHNTKWHFVIFTAMLVIQSSLSALDAETGLLPFVKDGEVLYFLNEMLLSACFVVWTVAFVTPKRHWWVRLGAAPQSGPSAL